jgi:hypothetical protein
MITAHFVGGPLCGHETQMPLPHLHLFIEPPDTLLLEWAPARPGYKLDTLLGSDANYRFYGWHKPIIKLS